MECYGPSSCVFKVEKLSVHEGAALRKIHVVPECNKCRLHFFR